MSASLDLDQEYCPFCGTDTDIGQKYCHTCGSLLEGLELVNPSLEAIPESRSLTRNNRFTPPLTNLSSVKDKKTIDDSWYQEETQEIFLPAWIQYSGVLNPINKPVYFLDVLDQLVCLAKLDFSSKFPGIQILFQLAPHLEIDPGLAEWKLVYELNSHKKPCWSIFTKSNDSLGCIESYVFKKQEKSLLARDIKGNELLLQANWTLDRILLSDLLKATLDLFHDTQVWQGFGSSYSISLRSINAEEKNFALICAGGLGGTFFQFNRCNELTRDMDFRFLFSLLGLQAFGIWDMSLLNDMISLRC